MLESMTNTWVVNRHALIVPTHYIIDKWGNSVKVNDRDKNVRSVAKDKYNTQSDATEANLYGLHIELVGDFSKEQPTALQYERLNILIEQIQSRAKQEGLNPLIIKTHSDFASKNCPGKLFDLSKVWQPTTEAATPKVTVSSTHTFNTTWRVTQYTPCSGSPVNDSESQWGSCNITSRGLPLINDYSGKMGACPPSIPMSTMLQIQSANGTRTDFECVDRGSAIQGNHIDLFVGVGTTGLNNFNNGVYSSIVGYRTVRLKH